jgi:hypothetical protein
MKKILIAMQTKTNLVILLTLVVITLAISAGCTSQTCPPQASPRLTKFKQFEKDLNDANIKYNSHSMLAQFIGAEEGMKYTWGENEDNSVELYRFKDNSQALKSVDLFKDYFIKEYSSYNVNDDMLLYFSSRFNSGLYKEQIMKIFNCLK